MFLSCALLVGRGGSSIHLQSYHIPNARLRASFDKMGRFDSLILLWWTEVVGDEGDFFGREELRLGGHGALAQGIAELAVATDPAVEVAEGTGGCLTVGEIQQGQFGLAVGADLEGCLCHFSQLILDEK